VSSLAPGTRLGSYEVVDKLGEGGMGVVWRAHDAQLGRDVALKVLPEAFSLVPERLARFEREAKLLAALNHTSIAQIYGLETSGATRALVMELVEGPTLADALAQGALPVEEALAVARQIAGALEEAHGKGIVHRDLKPQNIKLSPEGKVKVLDFGLAKAMEEDLSSASASRLAHSPTLTHGATVDGVILGTAAYMSPEQARGLPVDARADLWAFGVILFEMLTGATLFAAETVTDTLAGVLRNEIDFDALPADTPPAIRRLLRRCLARKAAERLHHVADARIVLDEVLAGRVDETGPAATAATAVAPARRGLHPAWLAAAVVAAAGLVATLDRTVLAPPPITPPRIVPVTYSGSSGLPSRSPDGRHVAFTSARDGTPRIWVKQLATGEEVAITSVFSFSPRVSPDGSSVLFGSPEEDGVSLFRVPLVGGTPRRVARGWTSFDARWSPDGKRITYGGQVGEGVDQRDELRLVDADSGREEVVASLQNLGSNYVAWSPDGERIAFGVQTRSNFAAGQRIDLLDLASGVTETVHRFPGGAIFQTLDWDGDGALVYVWAPSQAGRGPFAVERLELASGKTRTLMTLQTLPDRMEVGGPGELVLDAPETHQNLSAIALDAGAAPRSLTGGPAIDRQPAFSPDGAWVVFNSDRSGSLDLWAIETATGATRRLTYDAADDWDPAYSPDGKHLLWSSNRSGNFEVWMADADGGGARQVTHDGVDAENPSMTLDGQWIVHSSANPAHPGIWKVRPDGSEPTLLLAGNYTIPELSPRRGWIATILSDTLPSPTVEVVVVRLEDGSEIAHLRLPPSGGPTAGRSRWIGDSDELAFVMGGDDATRTRVARQRIVPGRDTDAERVVLLEGDADSFPESLGFSPDGRSFVVSLVGQSSDVIRVEGLAGIRGKSR